CLCRLFCSGLASEATHRVGDAGTIKAATEFRIFGRAARCRRIYLLITGRRSFSAPLNMIGVVADTASQSTALHLALVHGLKEPAVQFRAPSHLRFSSSGTARLSFQTI